MSNLVSKKGRIEYIEPNNINLASDDFATKMAGDTAIPHPYENYSIGVDLYVKKANRNSCGQPENNGNNTSFARFTSDSASFFGGTKGADGKGWLTANFTDIDTVNPIGNTNECLGITSISIEYQNIFMPIVRISFTDVRGASLFSKEEKGIYDRKVSGTNTAKNNKVNSDSINGSNLYKTLFMFPYPIFTLVVKGIYGDSVSYNLSITNVSSSFNDSTGDFEINVSFVGSLFGVLADIPMTFLAIAPYIEGVGKEHWENQTSNLDGRFKMYTPKMGDKPMPRYLDLIKLESNVSDNIKKNFDSNDDVKKYKNLLDNKHSLSTLKFPLGVVEDGSARENVWYCIKNGERYLYYFIGSDTNGEPNAFCKTMSGKIYNELYKFNTRIVAYNEQFVDNKINVLTGENNLLPDNLSDSYEYQNNSRNNVNLKVSYKIIRTIGSDGKVKIICYDAGDETKKVVIDDLKAMFPKLNEYISGTDFEKETNTKDRTLFIYSLNGICNFSNEIKKAINSLNKSIKSMQDSIEGLKKDALIKAYEFSPNIANMFGINFAHLETFMYSLYDCLNNIASKQPNGVVGENTRTLKNFGINVASTDLNPDKYKDENSFLPPFVSFYKHNEETNKDEVIWPGKIDSLKNLDEVKFIDKLLDAITTYTEDKESLDAEINPSTSRELNYMPTFLYEYLLKTRNPYREILKYIDKPNVIDCLVLIFALRYYYFAVFNGKYWAKLGGNSKEDAKILKMFAWSEANNFTKVIGKSKSEEVINNILNIYDEYNNSGKLDELFECLTKTGLCDLYPIKDNQVFTETTENGKKYIEYSWIKKALPGNESTTNIDDSGKKTSKATERVIDEDLDDENYGDAQYTILPISVYDFKKMGEDYTNNVISSVPGYITYITGSTGENNMYNNNTVLYSSKPGEIITKLQTYTLYDDTIVSGNSKANIVGKYDTLLLQKYYNTISNSGEVFSNVISQEVYDEDTVSGTTKSGFKDLSYDRINCQNGPTEYKNIFNNIENSCVSDYFSNVRSVTLNNGDVKKNYNIDDETCYDSNIFFHELYYNQNNTEQKTRKRDGDLIAKSKAYLFLFSLVNKKNDFLHAYYRGKDVSDRDIPEGCVLKTELLKEGAFWWRLNYMFNGVEDKKGNRNEKSVFVDGFGSDKEKAFNAMIDSAKENKTLYYNKTDKLFDYYNCVYTTGGTGDKRVCCVGMFMFDPLYINEKKYKRPNPNEIFYINDGDKLEDDIYAGLTYIANENTEKKYYDLIDKDVFLSSSCIGDVLKLMRDDNRKFNISIARVRYLIDLFESWATGSGSEYLGNKTALPSFKTIIDNFEIKSKNNTKTFTFNDDIDGKNSDLILDLTQRFIYEPVKLGDNDDRYLTKYSDGRSYYLKMKKRKGIETTFKKDYESAQKKLLSLLLDVDFIMDASRFDEYPVATTNSEADYRIEYNVLKGAFGTFIEKIKKNGYSVEDATIKTADKFSRDDLKLSLYLKVKNLYDRWLCSYNVNYWNYYLPPTEGMSDEEAEDGGIYACKSKESISTHMQYLDCFYNRIGYKLLVDLTKYCNTIKSFTTTASSGEKNINKNLNNDTMVTLMSEVAKNCNCMMLCLPFMFGTDGYSDLQSIFIPKDFNSIDLTKDTSTFAVVYKPDVSQHIDNNDDFYDDGYDIADSLGNINPLLPESITEGVYNYGNSEGTKIPAFGVTFGKQNQSYFNSVRINSDRAQMTEYAIKALQNVVSESQTGAKNAYSYGQDIYDFYANYIYSCDITMMGCMRITPLMYFQLNNIPMFHGAYTITSVSHSISPGSITTSFRGTRMSKNNTPFASGELFVLNTTSWGLEDYSEELANLDEVWVGDDIYTDCTLSNTMLENVMTKTDSDASDKMKKFIEESELYGTGDYTKEVNKPDSIISLKNVYAYSYFYLKNRLTAQYGSQYLRYCDIGNDSNFSDHFNAINFYPINSKSTKELETLMYTIKYRKITVGVNVYGSEIVKKLEGLTLVPGDVLVYYASEEDKDVTDGLSDKEKEKAKLKDGDAEANGAIQFYYKRKIKGNEYKFMSYNKKNDGKTFIFDTNKKRAPEYYKWNVDIYRFMEYPLAKVTAIDYDLGTIDTTVSGLSDNISLYDSKEDFNKNGQIKVKICNKYFTGPDYDDECMEDDDYELYDRCTVDVYKFDTDEELAFSKDLIISSDKMSFSCILDTSKIKEISKLVFNFIKDDKDEEGTSTISYYTYRKEIRAEINIEGFVFDKPED